MVFKFCFVFDYVVFNQNYIERLLQFEKKNEEINFNFDGM